LGLAAYLLSPSPCDPAHATADRGRRGRSDASVAVGHAATRAVRLAGERRAGRVVVAGCIRGPAGPSAKAATAVDESRVSGRRKR